MKIHKAERETLLKFLPRDYRKKVSERVGCHINTVANVLHHEEGNLEVYKALVEIAEENHRKVQNLQKRLKKLPA